MRRAEVEGPAARAGDGDGAAGGGHAPRGEDVLAEARVEEEATEAVVLRRRA